MIDENKSGSTFLKKNHTPPRDNACCDDAKDLSKSPASSPNTSMCRMDDNRDLDVGSSDEGGSEGNSFPVDNDNDNDESLKNIIDLTADDILGLEFKSMDDACDFYVKYARCHGFTMRKDYLKRNNEGGVTIRQLVCNKAGLRSKKHLMRVDRKREHRQITRTNCGAKLKVCFDRKSEKWVVTEFEEAHNHKLVPLTHIHLFPAYRKLTDADKAQIDSMHSNGVRTCHIMGYMVAQKGGYAGLGFIKKDLYNHVDRDKRKRIDRGDAYGALSYLQAKADNDPMLFSKYTTTDDGRMEHLFWADGASRNMVHYYRNMVHYYVELKLCIVLVFTIVLLVYYFGFILNLSILVWTFELIGLYLI